MKTLLLWLWEIAYIFSEPYQHLGSYMGRWWLLGKYNPDRDDRYDKKPNAIYKWITDRIAIRLHQIRRSDNHISLHDHPFNFISLICEGGYWEILLPPKNVDYLTYVDILGFLEGYTPAKYPRSPIGIKIGDKSYLLSDYGIYWRATGTVIRRSAFTPHRIIVPRGTYAKTIVFMGRKTKPWGFYTSAGWVRHDKFLQDL